MMKRYHIRCDPGPLPTKGPRRLIIVEGDNGEWIRYEDPTVMNSRILKVVTDLMESHDQLMAGIGGIVVDYALLNDCRIAGASMIKELSE